MFTNCLYLFNKIYLDFEHIEIIKVILQIKIENIFSITLYK